MLFALFPINTSALADPELMARVAIAADEAGIESVFTGEHVVVPDPLAPAVARAARDRARAPEHRAGLLRRGHHSASSSAPGSPCSPPTTRWWWRRSTAASTTCRAGGSILGIGVGYVPLEYEVLGLEFENRGRRTDEYIDAIRAMWTQPSPEFDGEFVAFSGINAFPRPVQQPPPILVGGTSAAAFRRVVERGNGWIGGGGTPDGVRDAAGRDRERDARATTDPTALGEIELTVTPSAVLDRDLVAQFEDLGVTRCIVGFRAYGFEAERRRLPALGRHRRRARVSERVTSVMPKRSRPNARIALPRSSL